MAYLQYRLAISAASRYVIGNPTGWGKNTMNDARGDGTRPDPEGEQFRAQFSWHGLFPGREVSYDNLGGSIQREATNVPPADTLGRLGASAFAGVVTLHADAGASDDSDDPGQPFTTNWVGSDDAYQSNNDPVLDRPDDDRVQRDDARQQVAPPRARRRAGGPTGLPQPDARPLGRRGPGQLGRLLVRQRVRAVHPSPRARASGSSSPRAPTG